MGDDPNPDPLFADPDWWRGSRKGTTPWDEIVRTAGLKLRIDAAAALAEVKKLYPAAYCQTTALTPDGRRFLLPLFLPFLSRSISEVLLMGHDLVCCSDWQGDSELVTRLRSPQDYLGGRLEVGVRSGMLRLGLGAFRPKAVPDEQRPDLIVHDDGLFVAIEEKAVSIPIQDKRVALLYDATSFALFHRGMKLAPTKIEIRPVARITEWASQRKPQDLDEAVATGIREAMRAWVHDQYDELGPGYRGEIPGVGSITIAPPEHENAGSLEWLGIVKKSFDDYVFRAFDRMRKASRQLGEYGHAARVGVVWMPAWEAPAPQVAQHLHARWSGGEFPVPRHLDVAVIFASQNQHGPSVPQAVPIPLTPRGHEVIRMRWREGLTNWRFAEW